MSQNENVYNLFSNLVVISIKTKWIEMVAYQNKNPAQIKYKLQINYIFLAYTLTLICYK